MTKEEQDYFNETYSSVRRYVKALKVTEEGKIEDLSDLRVGDNIQVSNGNIEVVLILENVEKGLCDLTTVVAISPEAPEYGGMVHIRNYVAPNDMLRTGSLRFCQEITRGSSFEIRFYYKHLIKPPIEILA